MELSMTVKKELSVENMNDVRFVVGDVIEFNLTGVFHEEPVQAMAVKREGRNMIFCFVDCLENEHRMNRNNTNEGGYEKSNLRDYLKSSLLPLFPEEIMSLMVPFDSGDFLRIPTEKEIFGENYYGEEEPDSVTQWEPMKLRRNRIAFQGLNCSLEWYWLQNRDVASSTLFARVSHHGGAGAASASTSRGVRPAFQIRDL